MIFLCTLAGCVLGGCWSIINHHQIDLITYHHPVQWVLDLHYQGNATPVVFAFFNCKGSHKICCMREERSHNSPQASQPLCCSQILVELKPHLKNSAEQLKKWRVGGVSTNPAHALQPQVNSSRHKPVSGIPPQPGLHVNTSAQWV